MSCPPSSLRATTCRQEACGLRCGTRFNIPFFVAYLSSVSSFYSLSGTKSGPPILSLASLFCGHHPELFGIQRGFSDELLPFQPPETKTRQSQIFLAAA